MGTGGIPPKEITQTITLYNTTGVIEKDKGIYYCPIMAITSSNLSSSVAEAWLTAFEHYVSFTSNYYEIPISTWSPKDRSLVVKGNADDFRLINQFGKAFNYLILTRTVTTRMTPHDMQQTFYYPFFITDVQQVGNGSVRLGLDSDNFTQAFYLGNGATTFRSYGNVGDVFDPFNKIMKNCYVNRQHYNRYEYQAGSIAEANLPIFSQIEESFKYKRQIRDYKEFINYGSPLTATEKHAIKIARTWSQLPNPIKTKALKLSTGFIHIVFKDSKYMYRSGTDTTPAGTPIIINNQYPNVKNVNSYLSVCCVPVLNIPKELKKFESDIEYAFAIKPYMYVEGVRYPISDLDFWLAGNRMKYGDTPTARTNLQTFLSALSYITTDIVSVYFTKESKLIDYMTFYADHIEINFSSNSNTDSTGVGFVFTLNGSEYFNSTTQSEWYTKVANGTAWYTSTVTESDTVTFSFKGDSIGVGQTVLCVEPLENINFDLDLTEESPDASDVRTSFIDPVLTFNPYSFYSISYLGRIEVPLNKQNYYEYQTPRIEMEVVATDTLKYSVVPSYRINDVWYKYYSESMEQTFANQLNFLTSALNEYVIANQSQMRNQFAVNNKEHEYGMITTAVSGVGNIVGGAFRGALVGGSDLARAGAVSGGAQTVTSLINEGISWGKDNQIINMNQKAKLADMGNLPSNLKQVGTDIIIDLSINEMGLYLNHYTIDEVSHNSICKYLERFGYAVNIYDSLHVNDRVGWNYIKLLSFDFDATLTTEQEDSIRQIFENGVTLLHDTSFLHDDTKHNYETIFAS